MGITNLSRDKKRSWTAPLVHVLITSPSPRSPLSTHRRRLDALTNPKDELEMAAPSSSVVQLAVCVGGIYVSFLVWALCQERISTTPYLSTDTFPTSDKFRSVLFVNTVQSAFCVLSASVYLVLTKRRPGVSWREVFGLPQPVGRRDKLGLNSTKAANGNGT